MKPCSRNRELIAWLALDALDARQTAALKEHLDQCEGCCRYWEEISTVTERLASEAPESILEASEFLHHRVSERVQRTESGPVLEALAAWLRGSLLNWRLALPATAVLAIALVVVVASRPPSTVTLPAPTTVQVGSSSSVASDLAPTLANYQMVASQSLEELDELLTRQGNKPLPPAAIYTASSLAPTNALF